MTKKQTRESTGSVKTVLLIFLGIGIGAFLMIFFFGAGLYYMLFRGSSPQKFDAQAVSEKSQGFNDADKPDFSQQIDKQWQLSNNTKRSSDINALLNAVNQYMADHSGTIPEKITDTPLHIAKSGADICALIVPNYIAALPRDPLVAKGLPAEASDCTTSYDTGYTIQKSGAQIILSAPLAEVGATISVSR